MFDNSDIMLMNLMNKVDVDVGIDDDDDDADGMGSVQNDWAG